MPKVRVGSDEIEFPDDMSDEQIEAALRRLYPPPAQKEQAPAAARRPAARPRPEVSPPAPTPAPTPVASATPAPVPSPPAAQERPQATIQSLAQRAAALRLAGENDKAVLVERQIDAMREREKRVASAEAREAAATEALDKGREQAAKANITARETDAKPPTARKPVGVELPAAEEVGYVPLPGSRADIEDIDRLARERARKTLELRNLPFSEEEGLIALEKQKERERRAATITATGGVEEGPKPLLPMLRPTRMVDTPTFTFPYIEPTGQARLYQDPDTGELREPTSGERFTEALARQPVMGESEALAVAAERIENPEARSAVKNLLTQRIEGEGIVETPLGASLRSLGTLTPAFLNTTLTPILTEGLGVESTRGAPVAFGADPRAKRRVDESLSYLDQISQGIEQGRGIGDELAQMPGLVKATAEAFGENEEYARNALWATGTLGEIFLPITPLGLPGKAASFLGKGAKVVAPVTSAKIAAKGKAVTRGIQDRALLGTMARRTYPEASKAIPAFGKEDDIVRIVVRETGIPADEVRTTLRAQVPDDLVQISDSVAAPKAVAAKEREAARRIVEEKYRSVPEAQKPNPQVVAREVDDILVKRADVPASGLKKLDDLSVRSLSPTPEGIEPSLFDGVVARTFSALIKDQDLIPLPLVGRNVIRPDNALAASLYNKVRDASFRASQDLRDDIVNMAKEIPVGTPELKARQILQEKIMDKFFSGSQESFDKLVDKVVEDGLGRIGDVNVGARVRAELKLYQEAQARKAARSGLAPLRNMQEIRKVKNHISRILGTAIDTDPTLSNKVKLKVRNFLQGSEFEQLLPIMAATIIEDVVKPSIVGDQGSILRELGRLQRGRPARAGEEAIGSSGAYADLKTARGGEWKSGLDSAFRPQDMFEPKALNASWTDSIKDIIEAGFGLRKRVSLYLASQFGLIPNLPAWTDRFIRGAMISASQIGLFRTGAAASDAYKIANAAPRQVLFTTSDGIRWTPELIASEGKRLGLGLSAQDAARQGAANRILVQRVQDELARRGPRPPAGPVTPDLDPTSLREEVLGPDYAALAGGVSDAYRQAVFAGGLKAGMRAEDAAALARRSLLDYSKTADNFLLEKVTPYFASAAETWESARALGDALARGTNIPIQAIRVENFMNRKEDPFSRQGDASRRSFYSLRFPLGDKQYEAFAVTNPVAWAVEGLLGSVAMIDGGLVTVNELLKGSETLSGAGAQAVMGTAKLIGSAFLGELEPRAPAVQAAPGVGKITEAEMLALMVHLSEPDGPHPEWRPMIDANFPMDLVNPPKGAAIPGYEGTKIWGNLPADWREKGLIWKRVSDEELASFPEAQKAMFEQFAPVRVYKPSQEAKNLLRGLRSLSPGVLEDSIRWYASEKAQGEGLRGGVGIPASQPSPTIAGAELLLRRGIREVGADERAAIEALRKTRAGE